MLSLLFNRRSLILGVGGPTGSPSMRPLPLQPAGPPKPIAAPQQAAAPPQAPAQAPPPHQQEQPIADKTTIAPSEGIFSRDDKAFLDNLKNAKGSLSDADVARVVAITRKLEDAILDDAVGGQSSSVLMQTRQLLEVRQVAAQAPEQRAQLQTQIDDVDLRLVTNGDVKALEQFAGNDPARQQALLSACQSNPVLATMVVRSPDASNRILTELAASDPVTPALLNDLLDNHNTPHAALELLRDKFAGSPAVLELIANHRNAQAPTGPDRQADPQSPFQQLDAAHHVQSLATTSATSPPSDHNVRTAQDSADNASKQSGSAIHEAMALDLLGHRLAEMTPDPMHLERTRLPEVGAGMEARMVEANIPLPLPVPTPRMQFAFFGMSNVAGSGVGFAASAFHSSQRREGYLAEEPPLPDGSRRYLQSISDQKSGGGGVASLSTLAVPAAVSGSLHGSKTSSVIYARVVAPNENGAKLALENPPPSLVDLARGQKADPTLPVLREHEEIAFRGSYNIGASIGVIEPHSCMSFKAGIDRTREYVTSIRRNEGDPSTYTVRVEPDTTRTNGQVTAGLGPFSVEGGGGKMHAVQYTFQMTEDAMRTFVGTNHQQLPALPDPRQALHGDGTMNSEVFNKFQEQLRADGGHDLPGVTLQSFGRTDEWNIYGQASAAIAHIRGTHTEGTSVTAMADSVTMTTTREDKTTSAFINRGHSDTVMRVEQGFRYQPQEGAPGTLSRSYEGAQVTFRISDTKTQSAAFQDRMEKLNRLLDNQATLPAKVSTSGASDIALQARVTADHIAALANMDPDDRDTKNDIQRLAKALGNDLPLTWGRNQENREAALEQALTQLIRDVRAAGPNPPVSPREQQQVEAQQTTLADLRRENQGTLMADFMAHSEVTVAALDRLLRDQMGGVSPLVNLVSSTETHLHRINAIGVPDFLSEPVGKVDKALRGADQLRTNPHMRAFTDTVDKLEQLRQTRDSVLKDEMLTPLPAPTPDTNLQRVAILRQIDESVELLHGHMDKMLADPIKREQIFERLQVAGSTAGGVHEALGKHFTDPRAGLKIWHDTFGHYDAPEVRNKYMDRVVDASLDGIRANCHDEKSRVQAYAGLVKAIAAGSGSDTGIPQLFTVLTVAQRTVTVGSILTEVPAGETKKLVKRMDQDDRRRLESMVQGDQDGQFVVYTAVKAVNEESRARKEKLQAGLEKLSQGAQDKIAIPLAAWIDRNRTTS